MNRKSDIFVIVPAYNEEKALPVVLNELVSAGYSVVIVDDGSTDRTKDVVLNFPVHYIRHDLNLGQGAALQTGISYAYEKGAEYFVTFDADGQHKCAEIEKMVEYLQESGVDIVFGSRFMPGAATNVSVGKRLVLNLARLVNYFLSGILLSDAHNGFRAFNRKAAKELRLTQNGMAHASEFLLEVKRNKFTCAEFPVTISYTEYSKSKGQGILHSIKILQDLLVDKLYK
jgi:polyprenyl-phospho-N-acetylgalactosaminyl synthase